MKVTVAILLVFAASWEAATAIRCYQCSYTVVTSGRGQNDEIDTIISALEDRDSDTNCESDPESYGTEECDDEVEACIYSSIRGSAEFNGVEGSFEMFIRDCVWDETEAQCNTNDSESLVSTLEYYNFENIEQDNSNCICTTDDCNDGIPPDTGNFAPHNSAPVVVLIASVVLARKVLIKPMW